MDVQIVKASSPSRSRIWTPIEASRSEAEEDMESHFLVSAASILRAAWRSMAQGAALSVAPMKPAGVSLLS